jgi:periplasmic protein TonB
MTPLKETLVVGEALTAPETSRPKPDSSQLRSDAVSLDVPVKIHGSRVVEVIRGTTPQTQPFEEQTSTMIVFPLGGVLKMTTPVNVGQAIVLTNLKTRQDAICRVIKIRTNPNLHSYVEVEFSHPQPGYWGVRFPSDGPEPPKKPASPAPVAAAPAMPPISAPAPKVEVQKVAPPSVVPVVPLAPETPDSSSFSLDQLHAKSAVIPPSSPSSAERFEQTESRSTEAHTEAESSANAHVSPAPEAPMFGRFAASVSAGERAAARPAFGASLDYGSPGAGTAEKPRQQGKNWVAIGSCVGLLLAAAGGGGFYFLHKRPAASPVAVIAPATPQPTSEPSIAANTPSNPVAPTPSPVQQAPAAAAPVTTVPPVAAPVATPPVVTHVRQAEPNKSSKPASSESAAAPAPSARPERSQSPKQNPATPVPDMFGALNAHPTAAIHTGAAQNGSAPSIDGGQLPNGQGIALPSSEPSAANLAPPSEPAPEGPLPVGGDVKAPQAISSVAVVYPEIARQAGVEGNVVVRVIIDKAGTVTEARALSGPAMLRDAAVSALRQRKYAPSKLNGHPISVEMLVTIQFRR